MPKEHKSKRKTIKSGRRDLQKNTEQRLERESLKQQPASSSISSSSDVIGSTDSYLKLFANSIEETNIFDLLQQTDTESWDDEEQENDQTQAIAFEPEADFLQFFGEVPNVDDMSEDISIAPEPQATPTIMEYHDVKRDRGKFVNPLTGLQLDDTEEPGTLINEDQHFISAEIEEESEKSFEHSERSSFSEQLLSSCTLEEEKLIKDDSAETTLAAFFELEKKPLITKQAEIDWEALVQAKESKALQEHTLAFLNELVNKVVHYSEHLSPEKYLAKNLDKHKLITELSNIWPELLNVRTISTFLNRQVVQHFRRKKSFRCITEDSPNVVLQEKQKFEKALEHLDQALAKGKQVNQVTTELQAELQEQYEKLKQDSESHIEIFENEVKKQLYRDGFNRIKVHIDRSLLAMSKYRLEISEVRLSLLLQQHAQATLQEQLNKINDLGNGLSMHSFTTFQAENQTLVKKLEERNADLNKLYTRCHNNVHILAHYKENQHMFYNTMQVQRTTLDALKNEERLLREDLLSLKLQRNRIHDKTKKLRVQGGLLDKPALMLDYDQTVKLVAEKREIVEYLRRTLLSTQNRIDQIIEQFPNINGI